MHQIRHLLDAKQFLQGSRDIFARCSALQVDQVSQRSALAAFLILSSLASGTQADTSTIRDVGSLIKDAEAANVLAQSVDESERLKLLRSIREMATKVLEDDPGSEEAAAILLDRKIGTVDLSQINVEILSLSKIRQSEQLEALGVTYASIGSSTKTGARPVSNPPVPKSDPPSVSLPLVKDKESLRLGESEPPEVVALPVVGGKGTVQTEPAIGPVFPADPKERIRLTQEGLNRVGCKVGTADGVAGAKTRKGHANYMREMGLAPDLYPIGSVELLANLASATDTICVAPPPIKLTPSRLSGTWSFVTKCGSISRLPNKTITGVLQISHRGGNTYSGKVRNSQGLNGKISATLRGRRMDAVTNWGLLFGKVQMTGTVSDQALVISGRDSNRCKFTARKR